MSDDKPTHTPTPSPPPEEGIRLVIWDLDDTFWTGTLSEGEISPRERAIDIVRTLNERGIVSAICSRNTFDEAKAKLEELDVWDEFVFPRIDWAPKGPLVNDIIKNIQLRPQTVMFIDDNTTNLNEVKYFVPDINIAEPDILDTLLDDPRFRGKPDPQRERLKRYKILEMKQSKKESFQNDNEGFLRESRIRISFHLDVEAQFERIHDLVNRTNQLNFTKNRWSENIEEARAQFLQEKDAVFSSNVGYVKVSDAYGNYGICGFYLTQGIYCKHFLFSCRAMNMGVEQFVWQRLGRPHVSTEGTAVSRLDTPVDWITVVDDADAEENTVASSELKDLTVCIRGACDLLMTSSFLRLYLNTIEEVNTPYQGWEIIRSPRILAVHEDLKRPENVEIIKKLPGMPPGRFDSDVFEGKSDVYVLSFSQESFHGLYRSKSTGMIIQMGTHSLPYYLPSPTAKFDYTSLSYEDAIKHKVVTTKEQWEFFASEFEFLGVSHIPELFVQDVNYALNHLLTTGKKVIIIGLNSTVGRDRPILDFFATINRLVEPIAKERAIPYIDINSFIHGEEDLAKDGFFGGPHFDRHIYKKISDAVIEIIKKQMIEA